MHALPVNYLSRYLAKFILNNDMLYNLMNIRLKRILTVVTSPMMDEVKIDFDSIKVSEADYNK